MRPPTDVPAATLPRISASFPPPAALLSADGLEPGAAILARFRELPAERLELLRIAAAVARESGCELYWVGGGVRDLWLGTSELDLDLVVDGELAPFGERLAARLGTALRSHPQFMTAELEVPGGLRVDLARARSERYAGPATLPAVAPGSLARDLERRDFTVNCLAIALEPGFGERLIDPCGGLADLALGRLRTLHPASFEDDPTRLLRGVEFAARFGFEFAPGTRLEAERAVAGGFLARLSPARLAEALRRALGRAVSASRVLHRLRELRLLEAIAGPSGTGAVDVPAPRCAAPERFDAAVRAQAGSLLPLLPLPPLPPAAQGGRESPSDGTFRLALLCLAIDLDAADRGRLAARLALPGDEHALLTRGPERVAEALAGLEALPDAARPSVCHRLLGQLAAEELAVVAARDARAAEWVRGERAARTVRLAIGGRELMDAGLLAGPALGRALLRTLEAKMDGRIDAEGELAFALRAAADDARGKSADGERGGVGSGALPGREGP